MKYTIITPSHNQLDYLKRCMASVADQMGPGNQQRAGSSLSVHHHVQDACSSDGACEYLAEHSVHSTQHPANGCTFSYESSPDKGMYDALNRGVELAMAGMGTQTSGNGGQEASNFPPPASNRGDCVIAWLNCDEQYLPGTLEKVEEYFAANPGVDILTGDYLVVDEAGELLSYRKGHRLRKCYVEASHLYTLSCATFYRSRVFERVGVFDTSFKAAADEDFMLRALGSGFKAHHFKAYLSVFTFSGENLGASQLANSELMQLKKRTPAHIRFFKPVINGVRILGKACTGAYRQPFPLTYSIYAGDAEERKEFVSQRAGWKWPASGPEGPTPRREDR